MDIRLPFVLDVQADLTILARDGRRRDQVDRSREWLRGHDVKVRDGASRSRRSRAGVGDEIGSGKLVGLGASQIEESSLTADFERMLAVPQSRVVLDHPRFLDVILLEGVAAEENQPRAGVRSTG